MNPLTNIINQINNASDKQKIRHLLPELTPKIEYLLEVIKRCQNFDETNKIFDELQNIQSIVSVLRFVHKVVDFPKKLIVFDRDFERIDDPETREYIYDLLKQIKYSLAKSFRD